MDTNTISGQIATVTAHWHHQQLTSDATLHRIGPLLERFATRAIAAGRTDLNAVTLEDCSTYVTARTRRNQAPALATSHLRRTSLRTLFMTAIHLGFTEHNPARDVELPPRSNRIVRPLELEELGLVRATALGAPRRRDIIVATVALLESGATTSEAPQVIPAHIDLDAATVMLPGAPPIVPRTAALTPWAARVLHGVLQRADQDAPLIYNGPDPSAHTAQASVVNRTRRLLNKAGLTSSDVRPASIRLCVAAADLAAGGRIEHAARHLGLSRLDTAADALGYDWADS